MIVDSNWKVIDELFFIKVERLDKEENDLRNKLVCTAPTSICSFQLLNIILL